MEPDLHTGAVFYGTRARDEAAEKIISEQYKNIDIKAIRGFGEIEMHIRFVKI